MNLKGVKGQEDFACNPFQITDSKLQFCKETFENTLFNRDQHSQIIVHM